MSRSGEYWTDNEEMKMIQHLQNGKTLKQVAEEHKRTRAAVRARLYQFAYELWREDITIENIAIVTTLDELHVRLAIESKTRKAIKDPQGPLPDAQPQSDQEP
jgi:hypothetical protein